MFILVESSRIEIIVTFIKYFYMGISRVQSQLRKQRGSHTKVGCQHHLKTNINLVPPKISKSIRYLKRNLVWGTRIT